MMRLVHVLINFCVFLLICLSVLWYKKEQGILPGYYYPIISLLIRFPIIQLIVIVNTRIHIGYGTST